MTEKNNKSSQSNVVDFLEWKRDRGLDTGDPAAIRLASRLADVFVDHGEEAYYNALIQASNYDKEQMQAIIPYVKTELKKRGYKVLED